jgi:four helix bundle protein
VWGDLGEVRVAALKQKKRVQKHTDLEVFARSFDVAMKLFECSKSFPREERYSLTDQMRRSSRSVCANVAEAWRKRRYEAAFVSKLSDSESEAAETQVWIQFAVQCGYLDRATAAQLYKEYDHILGQLVTTIHHSQDWIIQ